MYIAVIRAKMRLSERGTLKDKRSVLKRLMAEMEHQHRFSVAEVGYHDSTAFVEVGLVKAASDGAIARRYIDHVSQLLYEDPRFCYVDLTTEIIPMG
ncbi:MAG: DUF503 family protein [Clostridiales bacterium]|nr:DUF503 family protein [Clostridiales bacterium]